VIGGWGIALAGIAAFAAAVASATLGYRQGETARAQRVVQLKPELDAWHLGFNREVQKLEDERQIAAGWVSEAAVELSRMQARIVQLESVARRLISRTALEREEFDFDSEPGIGGPEELYFDGSFAPGRWEASANVLAMQVEDRWRQLSILEEVLKWRELSAAVRPEGRPVRAAYVSSSFGPRIDPFTGRTALHRGIDFAGRPGTEIVAVAAGIVTWSGSRSGYGETVEIDHGNRLVTRYAHNSKNLVEVGDVVTRGQPIAWLGSTGRATGPNLHFEVLKDGEAVNPLPYIE
jgi:murein DD-endopeptidase MepM/ murein hydrolase activator NlpD